MLEAEGAMIFLFSFVVSLVVVSHVLSFDFLLWGPRIFHVCRTHKIFEKS